MDPKEVDEMRLDVLKHMKDAMNKVDAVRMRVCLELGADPNMRVWCQVALRSHEARTGIIGRKGIVGNVPLLTLAANHLNDDFVLLLLEFGAEKTEQAFFYASKKEDFEEGSIHGLSDETILLLKP
jgi:hypothetical protein